MFFKHSQMSSEPSPFTINMIVTTLQSPSRSLWISRHRIHAKSRDQTSTYIQQADGGEQTEMWQFKPGTARASNSDLSTVKPRVTIVESVIDMLKVLPRGLFYAGLMAAYYQYVVR